MRKAAEILVEAVIIIIIVTIIIIVIVIVINVLIMIIIAEILVEASAQARKSLRGGRHARAPGSGGRNPASSSIVIDRILIPQLVRLGFSFLLDPTAPHTVTLTHPHPPTHTHTHTPMV